MNQYIRLLITLLFSKFKTEVELFTATERQFRVMPWDMDILGHMNNGTYLQLADVARVSWMSQTGILKQIVKNRWGALLGGNIIHYRKALKPFQKYKIRTELLGWHGKWVFLEHQFLTLDNELVSTCLSRAALRDRKSSSWICMQELSHIMTGEHISHNLPQKVFLWLAADDELVKRNHFKNVYNPIQAFTDTKNNENVGFIKEVA